MKIEELWKGVVLAQARAGVRHPEEAVGFADRVIKLYRMRFVSSTETMAITTTPHGRKVFGCE
jgi:hypothetical protein